MEIYHRSKAIWRCPSDPDPYLTQPYKENGEAYLDLKGGYEISYLVNETGWSTSDTIHLAYANSSVDVTEPSNFIYFAEHIMGTPDNGPMIGVGPANGSSSVSPPFDKVITNDMVYNLAGNKAYKAPARHTQGNNYLFADGHVRWSLTTTGRQWIMHLTR